MERARTSRSKNLHYVQPGDNLRTKLNYSPRLIAAAQAVVIGGISIPFIQQRLGVEVYLNRGLPDLWKDFGVDLFGIPMARILANGILGVNNPFRATMYGAVLYSAEELLMQKECGVNNVLNFRWCGAEDMPEYAKGYYDENDLKAYGLSTAVLLSMDLFAKWLHDSGKTDWIYRGLGIQKRRLY